MAKYWKDVVEESEFLGSDPNLTLTTSLTLQNSILTFTEALPYSGLCASFSLLSGEKELISSSLL